LELTDPLPSILIIAGIAIKGFNSYTIIGIVFSLLVIFITALISGAEISFFALKSSAITNLQTKYDFRSRLITKRLDDPKRLLASLIIAKGFLIICYLLIQTVILNQIFDFTSEPIWGFIYQSIIFGLLYVIFIEIIPKHFAHKNPEKFTYFSAPIISLFDFVFFPVSYLLSRNSSLIANKLTKIKHNITIDDLSEALNLTTNQINEDENILKGIVKFGNIDVSEIMKSRVDVFAVEYNTSFKTLLPLIIESGHSRVPVFSESFDNIKGILYIKDLLEHFNKDDDFNWQALLRPPYFVSEYKKINYLLKDFQKNKIHMAIVIDEYGGTNGIVTLEDVLEEIVGEITDESDEDEKSYLKINDTTYIFEGKTLLNDFFKILEIDDNFFDDLSSDADTIAGIILGLTGEIPEKNKVINYKNLTFTIEAVDKRRIKQIKVTINQ
jgi:gliding motility-associated protein GldE